MLKETYSTSVKEKIKKIIEDRTQDIKLQAKRMGKRPEEKWKDYLSEEVLKSVIDEDINSAKDSLESTLYSSIVAIQPTHLLSSAS